MAADHEKEEEEGWTQSLMQGFQAAGQKYRSIKLMPNLSSGWKSGDRSSFLASVQNERRGVRTQATLFRHSKDKQLRLLHFLLFILLDNYFEQQKFAVCPLKIYFCCSVFKFNFRILDYNVVATRYSRP